jgi:hypothetical protein
MAWVGLFALAALALPSTAQAQRHAPAGAAHRGVAVPRAYGPGHYHPSHPAYYRPYYYGHYYRSYYYPYYSPWSFSFGIGFGVGSYWGAYGWYGYPYSYGYPYAYGYPYSYAYPYPYPYPYYRYPAPSSSYTDPGAAPSSGEAEAYSTAPATDPDEHSGYGRLTVRVMPSGATIVVDGQPWDVPSDESRFSIELAAGPHQLEIRKEGYGSYVRAVDIPRGRTIVWNVSLSAGGSTRITRTVPLIVARR